MIVLIFCWPSRAILLSLLGPLVVFVGMWPEASIHHMVIGDGPGFPLTGQAGVFCSGHIKIVVSANGFHRGLPLGSAKANPHGFCVCLESCPEWPANFDLEGPRDMFICLPGKGWMKSFFRSSRCGSGGSLWGLAATLWVLLVELRSGLLIQSRAPSLTVSLFELPDWLGSLAGLLPWPVHDPPWVNWLAGCSLSARRLVSFPIVSFLILFLFFDVLLNGWFGGGFGRWPVGQGRRTGGWTDPPPVGEARRRVPVLLLVWAPRSPRAQSLLSESASTAPCRVAHSRCGESCAQARKCLPLARVALSPLRVVGRSRALCGPRAALRSRPASSVRSSDRPLALARSLCERTDGGHWPVAAGSP